MTDQLSDDRLVQVRESTGEALAGSSDPVVELRFLTEGARRGEVADGVGWLQAYAVGDGYVVTDAAPTWSNWYVVPERRIGELLAELAGDSWEVRSCSIEPEPDWLSRYR
ncbi:hypothetical protein [Candidatus Halobonum tyrrellensis]|uniref:Uncharacterized protein n=1 Tax=Candidatus Halobonum tyrrellensis G22 TaxID=1324957 RepID=V4HD33_9EURY|nr:hypothetical protein [Candidatus Halobonum tyrrellensis]ESP87973.1 hypothetical protein K933_11671 [Candidatus Halobonum tyrrellensis G22]